MATAEGTFPKVGNDPIYASELNDYHDDGRILQIYTDTGFDTSQVNIGTDSEDHELDDMTDVSNGTYVKIEITCQSSMSVGKATSKLQIQTKDIGGSYSDTFANTTMWVGNGADSETAIYTLIHYHTLTANEKSNGIKIKILGQSIKVGDGSTDQANISTGVTLKK